MLSDVLSAIDNGSVVALVLLDLSAAFDIVCRPRDLVPSTGVIWYRWLHHTLVQVISRRPVYAVYLKGQFLVLFCFSCRPYIAELQTLIQDSGLNPHHYADDTQIYGFCSLTPSSCAEIQRRISECIDGVTSWLQSSRLRLNTMQQDRNHLAVLQVSRFSAATATFPCGK